MNLRKIIRETIGGILKEADDNPISGILSNIETELTADLTNLDNIIKTQKVDIQNKDNQIKANLQLKSKLDQTTPQRKGLEVQIPQDQKDWTKRKKQLKDLENAQTGMTDAQKQIEKQKADIEAAQAEQDLQAKKSGSSTSSSSSSSSVLPSLPSAI